MSLQGFQCPRCGSTLFLVGNVRPVCRVDGCHAQMKPVKNGKVKRRVSKMAVRQYNQTYGTTRGKTDD